MTTKIKRYEAILIGLCIITIFAPMPFSGKDIRFDPYLLYDYAEHSKFEGRKLSVIIYETGSYLRCVIPFLLLWLRFRNVYFFVPFIIFSLEFIFYILWFGRGTDPYLILLSSILIFGLSIRFKYGKRKKI